MAKENTRHVISILMENETGALSRVAGLFSARGYNIESLTVAPTTDDDISRMTLVTHGDDAIVEQIIKQLNKLIDVVKVMDLNEHKYIEREMLILKVSAETPDACASVKHMVDIFRAHIIDVKQKTFTIEATGKSDKLDSFIEALESHTILEVVRSGAMGMARGNTTLHI
ncbi:MAG TPA: acetolactate synthase small subunit [Thiothrix sp.]|nr:acetolactate synthase small subunit [Thiothrix sp.]